MGYGYRGGRVKVRFNVNGEAVEVEARADEMLLDVLRGELDLTSVRYTCGVGVCGACTTVEGLGGDHPIQRAFAESQAFQCGYCTPGMILTAKRLLEEDPEPKEEKIRNYMSGNLCRCGCYAKIEDAVNLAASASKTAAPIKGGA
jgi:aerobic-type carbon monoxide dehydrogenase small subunit (CoxS/CutS family)